MGPVGLGIVGLIVLAATVALGVLAVVYLIVPLFRGIAWFVRAACSGAAFLMRQLVKFLGGVLLDLLRLAGAILTAAVYVLLCISNTVLARWDTARHYGDAIFEEIKTAGTMIYRLTIGRPLRLLGLGALVEGLETRMPQVVASAPGQEQGRRLPQFPGYEIVGTLPAGGSGAKLYVAKPDARRLAGFARDGFVDVGNVVIKAFSLRDGSELPQIIRESRALDAAMKLGLVLDHEFNNERFYYVTRYVPGQQLSAVSQQLHLQSGPDGLGQDQLKVALSLVSDLLRTLDVYHAGGLWHKDVKPDNIIVTGVGADARAHLVDLGLVTPLRSAMTLTTHGTEYFRDPDLVRMALKGTKVQDIDGTRFDVYAAGAVLYSLLENSFPAHGVLSRLSKKVPDALRWIVQRAMTDYDKRYPSAAAMFADLRVMMHASDMWAVKPIDLPSMQGKGNEPIPTLVPLKLDSAPIVYVPPPEDLSSHSAAGRAGSTMREWLADLRVAAMQRRNRGVVVALVVCAAAFALALEYWETAGAPSGPGDVQTASNATIRLSKGAKSAVRSEVSDPLPQVGQATVPAERARTPAEGGENFGDAMDRSFMAMDSVVERFGQAFTGFAALFGDGEGFDRAFEKFKRDLSVAMRTGNKTGNVALVVDLPQPLSSRAQIATAVPLLGVLKSQLALTGDVRFLPLVNASTPQDDAIADSMKSICKGDNVARPEVQYRLAKWLAESSQMDAAVWVRELNAVPGEPCKVQSIADLEFIVIAPETDAMDAVRQARVNSATRRLIASLKAVKDAVSSVPR